MTIITEKMIKQAEGQKEPFLVVSYDVPSENQTGLDEPSKIIAQRKRLEISNEFFLRATQIQKSVYIVSTEKVREIINFIETKYDGTQFEKDVNVKIIGTVFKETVMEILEKNIRENLDDIWNTIELVISKVDDFNMKKSKSKSKVVNYEKEDKERVKLKQQVYAQNRTLNSIEEKIKDLEKIGHLKIQEYQEKFEKVKNKRKNVIWHIDKLGCI